MSEREAIARLIGNECPSQPDRRHYELAADRIIAEHIEPLRTALKNEQRERDILSNNICEAQLIIEELRSALAKAERERDEWEMHVNEVAMQVQHAEALLAECVTVLDDAMSSRDLDETFDLLRALLAKLKARTGDRA